MSETQSFINGVRGHRVHRGLYKISEIITAIRIQTSWGWAVSSSGSSWFASLGWVHFKSWISDSDSSGETKLCIFLAIINYLCHLPLILLTSFKNSRKYQLERLFPANWEYHKTQELLAISYILLHDIHTHNIYDLS